MKQYKIELFLNAYIFIQFSFFPYKIDQEVMWQRKINLKSGELQDSMNKTLNNSTKRIRTETSFLGMTKSDNWLGKKCRCSQQGVCLVVQKYFKTLSYHEIAHQYENSLEEIHKIKKLLKKREAELDNLKRQMEINEVQLNQDVKMLDKMLSQRDSMHEKQIKSITEQERQKRRFLKEKVVVFQENMEQLITMMDKYQKQRQILTNQNQILRKKVIAKQNRMENITEESISYCSSQNNIQTSPRSESDNKTNKQV